MSPKSRRLARSWGRSAFGDDPVNYDRSRPPYPGWVWARLEERCGLGPATAVFEIGAGTGIATRALLATGASVLAVEPDPRLAGYLSATLASPALEVLNHPFEEAALAAGAFDLGVAATSFHWLDEPAALSRIGELLRPSGWWAMAWNEFSDDSRPDPFHEATKTLLQDGPRTPSSTGKGGVPFALAVNDRMSALGRCGAFEAAGYEARTWDLVLDAAGVVALYSTYSNMTARPPAERAGVLAELRRIAEHEFGGRVVRNMTSILYTARRRG